MTGYPKNPYLLSAHFMSLVSFVTPWKHDAFRGHIKRTVAWVNNQCFWVMLTALKVFKYGVFSDPFFPVFGLNTESKYETRRSRKNSAFGHFYAVSINMIEIRNTNWTCFCLAIVTEKVIRSNHTQKLSYVIFVSC